MPELPDITVYADCLRRRVEGRPLRAIRLQSPFVLRTVDPPVEAFRNRVVRTVTRLGKRVAIGFEGDLHALLHLMIAGRLHWRAPGAKLPKGGGLAAFDFDPGTLLFTEAGKKRRASLHLLRGRAEMDRFDRGGIEILDAGADAFRAALIRDNHTLKRALTDPRIVSGIGNAYSDEILHRARLSPFKQTAGMDEAEFARLYQASVAILTEWTDRLRREAGDGFPEKVTAFRAGMAVHGRFREPCPDCGAPVQRIVYAENEANYCARCQTGGKLLADRALSRLLKRNWPKSLEELEQRDPR